MTQNDQAAMNEQLTELRLNGLSIDGDNRYKQDLIDAVIGAMMFGAQGANPPPSGHWLEQFYVIAREERESLARVEAALAEAVGLLKYAMESSSFREILTLERDIAGFLTRHAQAEQQEPQGGAAVDDQDQVHQLAFEVGEPDEDGDGYHFSAEQLDEFVSKLNRDAIDTQPAASTTSDQYRAELYDEVWQKARNMGYGNVTDALVALERMKSTQPAAGEPVAEAWRAMDTAPKDGTMLRLLVEFTDNDVEDSEGRTPLSAPTPLSIRT